MGLSCPSAEAGPSAGKEVELQGCGCSSIISSQELAAAAAATSPGCMSSSLLPACCMTELLQLKVSAADGLVPLQSPPRTSTLGTHDQAL
mmetsp:Transcript_9601/g.20465  ORF Transcript_9601/g.20465 Transcript_9601/m.20465 type:complete len:90 (-) Transcript_9601:80-349(-)